MASKYKPGQRYRLPDGTIYTVQQVVRSCHKNNRPIVLVSETGEERRTSSRYFPTAVRV